MSSLLGLQLFQNCSSSHADIRLYIPDMFIYTHI